MLRDLVELKESLPIFPIVNASTLADLALPNDIIKELNSSLRSKGYSVGQYTSSFDTGEQHVIFPNQYFTLIGSLEELVVELGSYISIFDKIRREAEHLLGTVSQTQAYLKGRQDSSDLFENDEDIRLFSEFICKTDSNKRLGAKRLIGDSTGARGARDCFGSVILKCSGLADESSVIFGRLAYDLTYYQPVLTKLQSLSIQLPSSVLIVDQKIGEFVYKVISFLIQNNYETSLFDFLVFKSEAHGSANIEYAEQRLTSIFKVSDDQLGEEVLNSGGKRRWFAEPFEYDATNYYLSTEWTVGKDSRLDLESFASVFNQVYSDFEILITGEGYRLLDKNSGDSLTGYSSAKNEICYGAPGVGKSYSINTEVDQSRTTRTVFHADTQNSDFIGCLKPCMDNSTPPNVIYSFRPGPFVNALVRATNDASRHHWLVIEEINRAPAAAVFGEIFLLLDRDPDSGASELTVTVGDPDMLQYINTQTNCAFADGNIKIPGNLSLLATMNSSDQAVMPMDTAFKRRWQFKYMPLDLGVDSDCTKGNLSLPSKSGPLEVEWRLFAAAVNTLLTKEHIPEDKHLGPFFLSKGDLVEGSSQNALAGKLFVYLWDDVLRHGRQSVLFHDGIKTFGQLNSLFTKNEPIFNDAFYALIAKQPADDEGSSVIEEHA